MNEHLGQREDERISLQGLVVESGTQRGRNGGPDTPFTVLYVGRWTENLVIPRNGLAVGEVIDLTGVLVETRATYPKGGVRRVQFVKDAQVVEAVGK